MQRKLLSRGQWLRPSFLLIENVASAQPRRTWISTLVPERLRPTDLLDLSGMKKASCAVDGLTQPPSSLLYTSSRDAQKWSTRIAFPSNTRGFLYCHVPDPVHPAAAEVRFRLTPEVADDPQTAFELGEDLLLSPETPWRIHVISIARSRGTYEALATLLLRDGLASQEAMTHWAQAKTRLERRTQVLCRLGQPFVYRLDSQELWLYVADGLDIRKIPLKGLLRDSRGAKTAGLPSTYPYSGDTLCRFESGVDRGGVAVAHVRVLKALSPITVQNPPYDGHVPLPTVGDFLRGSNGKPAQVHLSPRHFPLAILLQKTLNPGFIGPLVSTNEHPRDSSRGRLRHVVSNLDPEKLDPSEFLDLSGREEPVVHVLEKMLRLVYHRHYAPRLRVPFPTGTHGFLYAAENGALRFRVTKDAYPSSFASGHDLIRPNGQPWRHRTKLLKGLA